jgi:hypothetical protein
MNLEPLPKGSFVLLWDPRSGQSRWQVLDGPDLLAGEYTIASGESGAQWGKYKHSANLDNVGSYQIAGKTITRKHSTTKEATP